MKASEATFPVNSGRFQVIVDSIDADLFSGRKWSASAPNGGARRYVYRAAISGAAKNRKHTLHRIIMERVLSRPLTPQERVDHISGDTLDNRRSNLRAVTHAENCQNRTRADHRNKSGYRGVCWHASRNTWVAQATFKKKHVHLGCFKTPEEANAVVCAWRSQNMPGCIAGNL